MASPFKGIHAPPVEIFPEKGTGRDREGREEKGREGEGEGEGGGKGGWGTGRSLYLGLFLK